MGLFGKRREDKDTETIISDLEALKARISKIPETYPTRAVVAGPGANTAREQIPMIRGGIGASVNVLRTGRVSDDMPIPKGLNRFLFASDLLKNAVGKARDPAFVGLVSTVINLDGVAELRKCIDELDKIAQKVRQLFNLKKA